MKPKRLLLLFIALAGLTVYYSCRKTDHKNDTVSKSMNYHKFFNEHQPLKPLVSAARQFVMNENDKYDFVDRLAGSIGFPYWDKSIIATKKGVSSRTEEGEEGTVFIPFVPESDSMVKATLAVTIRPGDTSFRFIGDWQYKERVRGSMAVDSTAENVAALFMLLQREVTGDTQFRLTDSSIFADMPVPPGATGRDIIIRESSDFAGRSNTYTIMYCFYGYVCGTPNYSGCTDANGCDYLNCPTGQCYATSTCIEFEVEEGTGGGGPVGGGGTGGGPTGGGAGGNSGGPAGGWNPPPCPGAVAARGQTYVNCTPGWVPVGGAPNPGEDPCAKANNAAKNLDSLYIKGKADSVVNTIPNLTTGTLEKGFYINKKIRVNPQNVTDTSITGYRRGNVQTGTDSNITITVVVNYLELLGATLHTHPPIGYNAHSAKDIYEYINDYVNSYNYHFEGTFVAAFNGNKYAIGMSDPAQAGTFLATRSQYLLGTKWNATSDIGKAFEKAYDYYTERVYNNNPDRRDLAYEMAMAAVLGQFNTGITLFKMNASGNFKPIIVKAGPDPKKPKRTIYIQDCL